MTIRVFIDGAAGTTGLQIEERLRDRADIALLHIDEAQRKSATARAEALHAADIAILCLPDEAAREAVALIGNGRTRVIDASTAHRVATDWVYGLPEVTGREAVARATRVSNPGCYATGFVALVAPLVRAGLVPCDQPLGCNAVSGYSGGGKAMIAEYEGSPAPVWRTYALGLDHKHVPEMQAQAGLMVAPLFAPAVVPIYSGMVVEVPLHLAALPGKPGAAALREALGAFYAGSPIVTVPEEGVAPTLAVDRLRDTDRMELFVFADTQDRTARLVAVLDNLGKGASGAAVQSLNLMAGLPETAGLRL